MIFKDKMTLLVIQGWGHSYLTYKSWVMIHKNWIFHTNPYDIWRTYVITKRPWIQPKLQGAALYCIKGNADWTASSFLQFKRFIFDSIQRCIITKRNQFSENWGVWLFSSLYKELVFLLLQPLFQITYLLTGKHRSKPIGRGPNN